MDTVDYANTHQEFLLEKYIQSRNTYKGESSTECESCGETIPLKRRTALPGIKLCVDCQSDLEKKK